MSDESTAARMSRLSIEREELRRDLASVLNRHGLENGSNTPDYILADYLLTCLFAFDRAVVDRATWYGRMDEPGLNSLTLAPPALPDVGATDALAESPG